MILIRDMVNDEENISLITQILTENQSVLIREICENKKAE